MSRAGRVAACALSGSLVLAYGPVVCAAEPPSITVGGSASLRVAPDHVSVSVGVETQGPTVAGAFDANKRKVESVVSALRAAGVQAKEIQTSDLQIMPRSDDDGKRLQGYLVSTTVTVESGDPSSIGGLLQAAVAAGANEVNRLAFSVRDQGQFQKRGLELAFQDARSKAEVLAALAKRELGEVVSVQELPTWDSRGPMNNLIAVEYASPTGMQSGSEQVNVAITVVFALQ